MKYKTTIDIISEAGDRNEAAEIAGEYLSGNLMSGVKMKCRTKPVYVEKARTTASVMIIVSVIALSVFFTAQTKQPQTLNQNISGVNAIQPRLKTSIVDKNDSKFKKEWQNIQTREALDYLKK